ncbi:hypothetical protein ABTN80_20315, partial [Acinetobacter baumannii]
MARTIAAGGRSPNSGRGYAPRGCQATAAAQLDIDRRDAGSLSGRASPDRLSGACRQLPHRRSGGRPLRIVRIFQ